jgi:hypothetical protein
MAALLTTTTIAFSVFSTSYSHHCHPRDRHSCIFSRSLSRSHPKGTSISSAPFLSLSITNELTHISAKLYEVESSEQKLTAGQSLNPVSPRVKYEYHLNANPSTTRFATLLDSLILNCPWRHHSYKGRNNTTHHPLIPNSAFTIVQHTLLSEYLPFVLNFK